MVRRGKIRTIDYAAGICRVMYLDNELISRELVVIATKKPLVGDEVVVVESEYFGACFADIYKEVAL